MGGVFDVTDFTGNPGGYGRLQMVAGQDLEPFWKIYTQHNREHIANHLYRYRIGQLSAADAEKQRLASVFPNPYLNYPDPSPDLLTNTRCRSALPLIFAAEFHQLRSNGAACSLISTATRTTQRRGCAS